MSFDGFFLCSTIYLFNNQMFFIFHFQNKKKKTHILYSIFGIGIHLIDLEVTCEFYLQKLHKLIKTISWGSEG